VRATVAIAWWPFLLVITARRLLGDVDQVRMAEQDAAHATLSNYYQFMNPLQSNCSASETASALETLTRLSLQEFSHRFASGKAQTCIQEVLGSKFNRNAAYLERRLSWFIPEFLEASAGVMPLPE
jgi:hypothetical protein